jgi:hypothetical protein
MKPYFSPPVDRSFEPAPAFFALCAPCGGSDEVLADGKKQSLTNVFGVALKGRQAAKMSCAAVRACLPN